MLHKHFPVGFRHCFVTGFSLSYKNKRNTDVFLFRSVRERARRSERANSRAEGEFERKERKKKWELLTIFFPFPAPTSFRLFESPAVFVFIHALAYDL